MVQFSAGIAIGSVAASASVSLKLPELNGLELRGINYNSRAGPDWAPAEEKCKAAADITADLSLLRAVTSNLRLYSLMDCDQDANVIPEAIDLGFKLDLGLWVGKDGAGFEEEKKRFMALKDKGVLTADVISQVHIGSEAVYRGDVTAEAMIAYYREIKQLVPDIPCTIADIGDSYMRHPEMIEAVDFVSANYFPFWEKTDISVAVDHFWERYSKLVTKAESLNKTVKISETGWATSGHSSDSSPTGEDHAAKYLLEFVQLAEEKDIDYYYFEGIDNAWKSKKTDENATVEASFGIFTVGRTLKTAIASIDWKGVLSGVVSNVKNPIADASGSAKSTSDDTGSETDSGVSNDSDKSAGSEHLPEVPTKGPATHGGKGSAVNDSDESAGSEHLPEVPTKGPATHGGKGSAVNDSDESAGSEHLPEVPTKGPATDLSNDSDESAGSEHLPEVPTKGPATHGGKGSDTDDEAPSANGASPNVPAAAGSSPVMSPSTPAAGNGAGCDA